MMMQDPMFTIHNTHLESIDAFVAQDPQLKTLYKQKYIYEHPIINHLPKNIPGIYTLCGGRQIGKSTLAKQWMLKLLHNGIQANSIAYFTGEVIVDHLSLIKQLQSNLQEMPQENYKYIIIDEVTYISNWDMGIKFLADAGLFEEAIVIVTGSDLAIIQEARMRFPGRRGLADKVNFHIHPLSFYEILQLKKSIDNLDLKLEPADLNQEDMSTIKDEFNNYLIHGGYLKAINNFALYNKIDLAVLDTYADWVRGDVIKHGKNDFQCQEFFRAMLTRLNSQVTWTSLTKDFSIEHHKTVAEYAELLQSMDAIFIQHALDENKLVAAPKKARKLIFSDPFIFHSIRSWLMPSKNPYDEQISPAIKDSKVASYLVEMCVTNHYRRWYPSYYIKAEGEVDVAYVKNKQFWPVEVKWAEQLRSKDLKQIQKYNNGIILGKQSEEGMINNTPSYPVYTYLAYIGYLHRDII